MTRSSAPKGRTSRTTLVTTWRRWKTKSRCWSYRLCWTPRGNAPMLPLRRKKVAHELHFNDKYTSMRDRSGMHPLHICQMLSQSPWGKLPEVEEGLRNPEPYHKKVPSATALHDAGVKFQVIPSDSNMGIGFDGGVLKLPCLVITQATV
ncbi:hypothetical protein AMTR_s00023p00171820 [Amborella trichopoda]|uniref:Uncharacterized protein n=1 Tax=Amborella trichopoda TaxID=13333 RepID=W1NJE4_AMBTC|nr:hypothetical protein AMTR_s00023p00171820 [Amborella trichopoda]